MGLYKIKFSVLIFGIVIIAPFSFRAFAEYDPNEFYPLAEGNKWEYIVNNDNIEYTVAEIVEGREKVGSIETIKVKSGNGGYKCLGIDKEGIKLYKDYEVGEDWYSMSKPFAMVLPAFDKIGDLHKGENSTIMYNLDGSISSKEGLPPQGLIGSFRHRRKLPLSEQEVSKNELLLNEGRGSIDEIGAEKIEIVLVGKDILRIEAGTFNDCLITYYSSSFREEKSGICSYCAAINWYAPGVGLVKCINWGTDYGADGNLIDFSTERWELRGAVINGKKIGKIE